MVVCLLTGFSSGLPLWVTVSMLQAWLRERGVSLVEIGLFNLTGLPYTWKFLWAPLIDRYRMPFLGRRRGWALVTQVIIMLCVAGFGWLSPERSVMAVAALAMAVAFFSATQDVALDAYRRELLADHELGLGNAMHVNAYRAAALVPGSLALILADHIAWRWVFAIVAAFMAVGILASIWMPEPAGDVEPPPTLAQAVVGPFREFFARSDRGSAVLVLLFMLCYKLGDTMASALLTPFYLDLGFSKTAIGSIAKGATLPGMLVGVIIGGVAVTKIGINRALWIFGVLQLISTLGFALLASIGPVLAALGAVVTFEYVTSGLGTSAFIAFLARATHRRFTATQYALFSSLIAWPRTLASASTGFLVEALGYRAFFIVCGALAIPGMFLLLRVAPWRRAETPEPEPEPAPELEQRTAR